MEAINTHMSTTTSKPRKPRTYKSPESKARERAHQFGQPGGNAQCSQSVATNQREFYRWVETVATRKELEDYIKDKTHPWSRIHFCELWLNNTELDEVFAMTNQTHGAPKQPIEVQSLPVVQCEFFGDE